MSCLFFSRVRRRRRFQSCVARASSLIFSLWAVVQLCERVLCRSQHRALGRYGTCAKTTPKSYGSRDSSSSTPPRAKVFSTVTTPQPILRSAQSHELTRDFNMPQAQPELKKVSASTLYRQPVPNLKSTSRSGYWSSSMGVARLWVFSVDMTYVCQVHDYSARS